MVKKDNNKSQSITIRCVVHSKVQTWTEIIYFVFLEYVQNGQKSKHYQESSLNRIINRQCGYVSHQFLSIKWTQKCYVCIKYSMYDPVCDVISCCFEAATL